MSLLLLIINKKHIVFKYIYIYQRIRVIQQTTFKYYNHRYVKCVVDGHLIQNKNS